MSVPLNTPPSDTFFSDLYRRRSARAWRWLLAIVAVSIVIASVLYLGYWRAPREFPLGTPLVIERGAGIAHTAAELRRLGLVRSAFWFKAWSVSLGGPRGLRAGVYTFAQPLSAPSLAWRLNRNGYGSHMVRLTVPEGTNNRQLGALLAAALPSFNAEQFLALAAGKEGYLFPDTYHLDAAMGAADVIAMMSQTFEKRIEPLAAEIARFGRPLTDVIGVAALVEEEARTDETRRKVAGILWKRLDAGMPLQVDAVFPYIFGDRPFDLTDGDLNVNSPYNTYRYAGLPPTPITNPGLDSIRAAITPIETPYWYYLSDREGTMHYAVSHDEHLANRARYLQDNP